MNDDPRRLRTLQSIQTAFARMVVERRYHEIKIEDILAAAGIARSTFYEHFASKDALLADSISGPFSIMAGCVEADADIPRISALMEHFWQNRSLARTLLTGDVRRKVAVVLAAQIEKRLKKSSLRLTLPMHLACSAMADMQLAAVTEWLLGRAKCEPEQLARALHQASKTIFRS